MTPLSSAYLLNDLNLYAKSRENPKGVKQIWSGQKYLQPKHLTFKCDLDLELAWIADALCISLQNAKHLCQNP